MRSTRRDYDVVADPALIKVVLLNLAKYGSRKKPPRYYAY